MTRIDNLERDEREALKAFDEIAQAAQQFSVSAARPAGVVALTEGEVALDFPQIDLSEVCRKYSNLKPSIEIVLAFVGRIPIYGTKIVMLVRLLMGIADAVCPLSPAS